ncbi:MAG: type II secretion system protein [Candidatus Gastranaerophilaceae bacterium]
MKNYKGFTLTEVLLAVVIVGIIAALVLPTLITNYQDKSFSQKYTRETQTIKNTIDGLAAAENKGSFFETMMYVDAEPQSYADSSEKFLKKYMRVSKLCGDNNGDCFAKTYYEYKGGDKIVYKPAYKGSCAILKNGSSICITPQINNIGVSLILDINGPKGPNVIDKDLREIRFDYMTRTELSKATGEINDTNFLVDIKEKEDPCDKAPFGLECCLTKDPSTYKNENSACCNHLELGGNSNCKADPPPPPDPCEIDKKSLACCNKQPPESYQYFEEYSYCCVHDEIKKAYPGYCTWIKVKLRCLGTSITNDGDNPLYTYFSCTLKKDGTSDEFMMTVRSRDQWGAATQKVYSIFPLAQPLYFPDSYNNDLIWSLVNQRTKNSRTDLNVIEETPDGGIFYIEYEGPNF